jgi:hypothetical protein
VQKLRTSRVGTIVLLSICVSVTGCSTTRTLPRHDSIAEVQASGVKPGTKVVVTLTSGEVRTFRITAVEGDALLGSNTRIPYADIAKLEVKRFDGRRTAGVAGATLLVLLGGLVYLVHQAANYDD